MHTQNINLYIYIYVYVYTRHMYQDSTVYLPKSDSQDADDPHADLFCKTNSNWDESPFSMISLLL